MNTNQNDYKSPEWLYAYSVVINLIAHVIIYKNLFIHDNTMELLTRSFLDFFISIVVLVMGVVGCIILMTFSIKLTLILDEIQKGNLQLISILSPLVIIPGLWLVALLVISILSGSGSFLGIFDPRFL